MPPQARGKTPGARPDRQLTPREFEVLRFVIIGLLNKQIAAELQTAEKTVKVHRGRVMQKLGLTSVPDLGSQSAAGGSGAGANSAGPANLIMNAVEALPPAERRIIITTRSLKGERAEVSVPDFGAGLPKDQPHKVFDHFFSTKQTGMGMGLTIVRSIIEMHGGRISAENAPDRGARFSFHLPAARHDSKSQAA